MNLRDGSVAWDTWALGAIILESDMEKDEYFAVNQERGSIVKATAHLDKPGVCRHLKEIVRKTVLVKEEEKMMSIDDIITLLKLVTFKRYI